MNKLSKDNFDTEVLKADVPVLVDFWAPWCGPCRMQSPIIEELATLYSGKPVKIVALNVEDNQDIATQFNIFSIPTLMLFYQGSIRERIIGLQSKDILIEKIEKHLEPHSV